MAEVILIVRLVFGKLGWNFNSKCVFEPSTVALYNGMWIDSHRFEIRATAEKIDAARRQVWVLWFKARDGQEVEVKELQRLAGRLQSMRMALEGVAVWTRGLFADIRRAQAEHGLYMPKHATTPLREAALTDLWFWALRLSNGKFNGQPIREEQRTVQVTMSSDASDMGWGASSEDDGGWREAGELPVELLGQSSTAREIKGLMLAAERKEELLRGKNVRIQMDSFPAIRNLINGGGPVDELNAMVRDWWMWCKERHIWPSYMWIPREQNTEADRQSKKAAETWTLTEEAERTVRNWLQTQGQNGWNACEWLQTRVQAPVFSTIGQRIEEMVRSRRPACIVVPTWGVGQLWRHRLLRASVARLGLGPIGGVLRAPQAHTQWTMEAHILEPETHRIASV